ncbi:b(0,+)-type amino acid transporter 1-like [Dermacentor silvarum]|uniref:b(0,+)-type amino acid transporter 1-like n=1 Tax=Dermacentor silvarum TaxID=543639 RepID=UPI002100CF20|nr:b(0,+)-type amino acid transporter 1-like [Dermacentor silvarum]
MAEQQGSPYGRLRRDMGLFSAVAVVVGNCVGAGIFITSSIVYQEAGSVGVDLLIWVAAGVASLIHGLCIAEMGTMLPSAGGAYEYLKVAVESLGKTGDAICFVYSWCFILVDPIGAALHALTFTSYFLGLVYGSCPPPQSVTALVSIAAIELSAVVNIFSLRTSMKLQNYIFIVKLCVLIAIIGTGIVWAFQAPLLLGKFSFSGQTTPRGVVEAFSVAMFNGAGSTPICCMAEEMSDPCRTIPRALLGGLFLVTALHVLTNMAYFVVLDPACMTATEATAATFARLTWGTAGHFLVPIIVCVCTFGTMSCSCLTNVRLFMAAARNKHLPEVFSLISIKSSIPVVSIFGRTCIAMAFTVTGSVGFLAKSFMASVSVMNVMSILAMLKLRRTLKDTSRGIRVPTFLIFLNLVILLTLVVTPFLGRSHVMKFVVTFGTMMLGFPAYFFFGALSQTTTATALFHFVQKLFQCVPCVPYRR